MLFLIVQRKSLWIHLISWFCILNDSTLNIFINLSGIHCIQFVSTCLRCVFTCGTLSPGWTPQSPDRRFGCTALGGGQSNVQGHIGRHLSNNVLQKQKKNRNRNRSNRKYLKSTSFLRGFIRIGCTRSTPSRWVLVFLTFSLKFWILWNSKSAVTRSWRHVRWKPMQRPWPILWWAKVTSWHRMVWHQESNETLWNPLLLTYGIWYILYYIIYIKIIKFDVMRSQLQDFFQHGDIVLRLRHRQPLVALGPPSSWPDRRRVAKKHKKRRSWKEKREKCEASVASVEKTLNLRNFSFLSALMQSRICPRFKGGEDLWLGWGRWFSWLHGRSHTLVLTSFKISNASDKMRPRFVDLNNNNNNNNNKKKKKKKKELKRIFVDYFDYFWIFTLGFSTNWGEAASITLNRNAVHGDASALSPGGVRVGAPAMTTRGCTQEDTWDFMKNTKWHVCKFSRFLRPNFDSCELWNTLVKSVHLPGLQKNWWVLGSLLSNCFEDPVWKGKEVEGLRGQNFILDRFRWNRSSSNSTFLIFFFDVMSRWVMCSKKSWYWQWSLAWLGSDIHAPFPDSSPSGSDPKQRRGADLEEGGPTARLSALVFSTQISRRWNSTSFLLHFVYGLWGGRMGCEVRLSWLLSRKRNTLKRKSSHGTPNLSNRSRSNHWIITES